MSGPEEQPASRGGDVAATEAIGPDRLMGFSDGVMAVIITILVLQFVVPRGAELADLLPLLPTFFVYVLSFSFVGIYWNNHHHLLRVSARIGPAVMWSNLHFLFWLALMPFATAWLGQNLGLTGPTVLYGALAFITGGSYAILQAAIIRTNPHAGIAERIGRDYKALASLALYGAAIVIAFVVPWLSLLCFTAVSVIWLIPDRRLTLSSV
jgi:uncharacterized membrane protein